MINDGVSKSAILLMSLGEAEAGEIIKHLGPKEVQRIGAAMAELGSVSRENVLQVLLEFYDHAMEKTSLGNSDEFIRAVMTRGLGTEKAGHLLDRILQDSDVSGIEDLKWMDARQVAELIANEHPQIIATILVHLERDQASEILAFLNERVRNDVVLRIATLDGVQPQALRELNDALISLMAGNSAMKKSAAGGIRAAAEILNYMAGSVETSVLSSVREYDADLAQKIQDEMFTFENLLDLEDQGVRLLLREIPSDTLVVALKGTTEALRDKIFRNMSQRAAEMLRDDLEARGPVRISEVEAQQKEILKTVRRLAEEGLLVISSRGDESFV